MAFFAILAVCVPVLLLIAAVVALELRKRRLAAVLGLLSAATAVVLAVLLWQAYISWNPKPHHFQDMGCIPDVAAGVADWVPQLRQAPVDHVYYYNTRRLRSEEFFRCHFIHKADFDNCRQTIRSRAPATLSEREKGTVRWLGAESREYKTIKSWWDWPDKPGCEILCLDGPFIVVFDEAASTMYFARGDD
jgi:hypothetical protein